MKIEHIGIYEMPFIPELVSRFEIDTSSEAEDVEQQLCDIWYDCDHVKLDGEKGRGNYRFFDAKTDSSHYIIYDDEPEEEVIDVVNWWLNGRPGEIEIENTWDEWDKVRTGIAYRGGSGYCYALYAKELIA